MSEHPISFRRRADFKPSSGNKQAQRSSGRFVASQVANKSVARSTTERATKRTVERAAIKPGNARAKTSRTSEQKANAKATLDRSSRLMGQGLNSLIGSWANRDAWVVVVFLILTTALAFRLITLMLFDGPTLQASAQEQRTVSYNLTARRGTIYDRNGNILAISVDAISIYVDPSKVADPDATAKALRAVLGGTQQFYLDKIERSASPTFNYIYKKLDPGLADQLEAANEKYRQDFIDSLPVGDDLPAEIVTPLTGIDCLYEPTRVYPYGNVGAQVIGAVGDDGVGLSGIEQSYDPILRGVDGSMRLERGKDGRPIPGGIHEEVEAIEGQDIILTLDIDLQAYVETKLADYGVRYECNNANTILLDGASGEMYAAASLPLYDRENIKPEDMENGATASKAITFGYEPGSIFKTVTAATALENNVMDTEDVIGIPAYLELDEYIITDSFDHDAMQMSLRDILVHSSNIGISLVEDKVGDASFYTMIDNAGFGHPTRVDYPGETVGSAAELEDWNVVSRSNMSFGQGIQVSSLQIASFYGAIANYGVQVQPHFLMARPNQTMPPSYSAKRIMSESTSERLESMLRSVVEIHAPRADVEGYQVVGKTGTAEKASADGGYLYDDHIVSFVGYMANTTSQLVCLTSFDNPLEQLTAPPSQPLFREIMSYVANRYMVSGIDAIAKAKAALSAAALAGELELAASTSTNSDAAGDGEAAAGSLEGLDSASSAGFVPEGSSGLNSKGASDSNSLSASANTSSTSALARRYASLPKAYSLADPVAQPVLRGEQEGWLLDTSG